MSQLQMSTPLRQVVNRIAALGIFALLSCTNSIGPGLRLAPAWSAPLLSSESIGGSESSVPSADAALLVFSAGRSGEAVVIALDPSTGVRKWVRPLPGSSATEFSTLILTPNLVIRSTPTRLSVLDRTGTVKWDSTLAPVGSLSWATARGDTVLVATGRSVAAWRLSSGSRLWMREYPQDSSLVRLTGVTVSGDTVYASGTRFIGNGAITQGIVLALRLTDGTVRWTIELDPAEQGHFMAAPTIVGAVLLLTDFGGGGMQAIDRFARQRLWRTVGLPCCVGGSGTPLVLGSAVFMAGGDETARALDVATGAERWHTLSQGSFSSEAVLCGNRFWSNNLALRAFDVGTGAPQGVALDGTEEFAASGLATSRELVFVAGKKQLYAFACQ